MALYFQLTREGSREPATINSIDNAICQNLGLPWSDDKYVLSWFDVIGFSLACGNTFAQTTDYLNKRIAEMPDYPEYYRNLLRINHFLAEHYSTDSWAGR